MNNFLEIFKKAKKDEIGIDFYNDYQVTQEQHDWWVETVKPLFKKKFKLNKVNLGYNWGMMYLDCSPKIKKEYESK